MTCFESLPLTIKAGDEHVVARLLPIPAVEMFTNVAVPSDGRCRSLYWLEDEISTHSGSKGGSHSARSEFIECCRCPNPHKQIARAIASHWCTGLNTEGKRASNPA